MSSPSLGLPRSSRHSIPTIRDSWIDRPDLLDRLHGNIGAGLAVVQAAAGYGKTTLLSQFATDAQFVGFKACWVSLDSTSAMPSAFALQLAEAFDEDEALPHLAGGAASADLKAFVARAVLGMRKRSDSPVLLVLDNTQELAESPDSLELLTWLIGYLPKGYEVILSGREALALDGAEGALASGDSLWLGTSDLAFSAPEIEALQSKSGAGPFDANELMQATAGWPIGVMAVHRGNLKLDSSTEQRGAGAWDRYLAGQVWSSVPDALKPAIITLAVTPEIDEDLALGLIGRQKWTEVLAWFEAHSWLVEHLEDGCRRLNPLLRKFLLNSPELGELGRIHSSAEAVAGRLEESGRFVDALEAALAVGHQELLAGLLERNCGEELLRGSFAVLRRAFEGLSEDQLTSRPLLRAYWARVKAETGDASAALEDAAALLEENPRSGDVAMNCHLARIRALRFTDQIDEIGEAFTAVQSVADVNDAPLMAEILFHQASYEIAANSDFVVAEKLLQAVIGSCVDIDAKELELLARSTLGQVHAMRGQAPRAVQELTVAVKGWRTLGGCSNVGWVLNNLGMAHILGGDFKSAVPVLTDAIAEAAATGNIRSEAYATASLADAELAQEDWQNAQKHYQAALDYCVDQVPDPSLAVLTIVGYSAALLGAGEVEQADFYLERAELIASDHNIPFDHGSVVQQRSAVLTRAGDNSNATMFAHEAKLTFQQIDSLPSLRLATYRYAMCLFNEGNRDAAAIELLELGENTPEPWMTGMLRPLVAEAPMFAQWAATRPGMSPLLREFLSRESMRQAPIGEAAPEPPTTIAAHRIQANSLGPLSVTLDGEPVTNKAWESARAKEMFFLLLNNQDGIRKEDALEQLSPGLSRDKQNSTFHSNLYRVRHALYGLETVRESDGLYLLDPDADIRWDVRDFETAMDAARNHPQGSKERADAHQAALEMYNGPFAKEFFNDWAAAVRVKAEGQMATALSGLASFLAANGKHEAAIECLERLMQAGGLNEEVALNLITMKARAGQADLALILCDEVAARFDEELDGAAPGRLSSLRAKIASGIAV